MYIYIYNGNYFKIIIEHKIKNWKRKTNYVFPDLAFPSFSLPVLPLSQNPSSTISSLHVGTKIPLSLPDFPLFPLYRCSSEALTLSLQSLDNFPNHDGWSYLGVIPHVAIKIDSFNPKREIEEKAKKPRDRE